MRLPFSLKDIRLRACQMRKQPATFLRLFHIDVGSIEAGHVDRELVLVNVALDLLAGLEVVAFRAPIVVYVASAHCVMTNLHDFQQQNEK